MPSEQSLLNTLDDAGIVWTMHEHEAVFTVEQSVRLHAGIPGIHTKNLFLRDASGEFWVVSAPHDAQVDLKALCAAIGAKKVSFGKPDDMMRLLGAIPGAVTPLAAFNDTAGTVKFVIDGRLAAAECLNVHPLRNTATISLCGSGLLSFLTGTGHVPVVIAVPASP